MKISEKTVIDAIENIVNSSATNINMFWGLLSLFSSAEINNEKIKSQTTYCISQDKVGALLTDWFSYKDDERLEEATNKTLFFILSLDWSTKLAELMKISSEENKPNIVDFAIFFSKNIEFTSIEISVDEIVANFIDKISIDKDDLSNIFKMKFENKTLELVEDYTKANFFKIFKRNFSISNDYTTLSLDREGTTIASHPKELSRAPYIQTLYSGMSIQNIILVSNHNLEKGYRFGSLKNKMSKSDNKNTIYYGAPGTGKSHTIEEKLETVPDRNKERVTFHPDYDYVSFVGGYRPITEGDDNIKYKFVPQVFTNIYVNAWNNPQEQFYLVIEEINRGNCAEIFGDIFQLLDQNQKYTVTPSSELKAYLVQELSEYLEGIADGLKMPNNLSILATMNTSDQSLFPMDSAFKRRWDWEYIPINYDRDDENKSSKFIVEFDDKTYFSWLDFIEKVNIQIKSNPNLGMDKCIGNYFINPTDNTISLKTFINKAIFYLWNDVFKDEFGDESIFAENVTYEDFFPVEKNGAQKVKDLLVTLDVELLDKAATVSNEDTN